MGLNHGPPKIRQKVWILIMGTMVLNPIWVLVMAPGFDPLKILAIRIIDSITLITLKLCYSYMLEIRKN